MPTLTQGQTDDLKVHNWKSRGRQLRVWLSRMTVEDGMPYNNQVTVEQYLPGNGKKNWGWGWNTVYQYQAR